MLQVSLDNMAQLMSLIEQKSIHKKRLIIGISGCPGAGKSSISHSLQGKLANTKVVQMDGFHLSNSILEKCNLLDRKGSPDSFDLEGFRSLLGRICSHTSSPHANPIYAPLFDREIDASIGSAVAVESTDKIILVEGNYLLLDKPGWRELKPYFDLTLFLDVDENTLLSRLTQRWLTLGLDAQTAINKVQLNDALNIKLVTENLLAADIKVIG